MRGSIVGPMAIGGAAGLAGAICVTLAGGPLLAAFLAYSLIGASGVLAGAYLVYRQGLSDERRKANEVMPFDGRPAY